jgi:hypothetical protein
MMGIHYCGGEIQNIALFSKSDGCDKEKQLPLCHRHELPACCEDETVVHEGKEFKNSTPQINIPAPPVVNLAWSPVLISEIARDAGERALYNYDTPLRTCDLTVSLRVFLI